MTNYLRDINVMVVESQPFTGALIRQMLRVLGARNISIYENAQSAWEAFKRTPADIVFTDWKSKNLDGIAFTKLLRGHDESPNQYVPIIMATAHREEEHVHAARDAGVNEYVIKPLSPKSLFTRIESVVERPRRFVRIRDFFGPDRRRISKEFAGEDKRGAAKKLAAKSKGFAAHATQVTSAAHDPFGAILGSETTASPIPAE